MTIAIDFDNVMVDTARSTLECFTIFKQSAEYKAYVESLNYKKWLNSENCERLRKGMTEIPRYSNDYHEYPKELINMFMDAYYDKVYQKMLGANESYIIDKRNMQIAFEYFKNNNIKCVLISRRKYGKKDDVVDKMIANFFRKYTNDSAEVELFHEEDGNGKIIDNIPTKGELCKKYKANILIDDTVKEFEGLQKYNVTPVLFASSWSNILNGICKMLN